MVRHWLFLWLLLTTAVTLPSTHAQTGADAITFSGANVHNNFPTDLTFSIVIESAAGEITAVTLFRRYRDDTNTTRQVVAIEPGQQVNASYTWDTSNITLPPGTPLVTYWEAVDDAGNRVRTEETEIFFDDIRYDWQILEDDNIAVWWHDRSQAFGRQVFDIAQEAFAQQQALFDAELEHQIRILIYNDFDEFAAWHSFVNEFVGGQAFPAWGLTTQIVSAYGSQEAWLRGVIPHEISHLYFYQATAHPLTTPPTWLNEGLAQYNEFDPNDQTIEYVQTQIAAGRLIPLWTIAGSFGNEEEKVRLAYAEGLSAVTFLVEEYGAEGLAALLAGYKEGLPHDEAMPAALGVDQTEFELAWLAWQGFPPEIYPTRPPETAVVFPTNPPMMVTPTRKPTATLPPTAEAFSTATPPATDTAVTRTGASATEAAAVNLTVSPPAMASPTTPVDPTPAGEGAVILWPLLLGGGLVAATAVWWWRKKSAGRPV